ncbi:unnamed protein product [Toxocara canis]|uniref:Uncharacterized protein n=1 Tax=Toxocara canis TaxID=6265 RepID=A0A183TVK9_TOXCA|nr:unnamed protein product [Toxocara canis]
MMSENGAANVHAATERVRLEPICSPGSMRNTFALKQTRCLLNRHLTDLGSRGRKHAFADQRCTTQTLRHKSLASLRNAAMSTPILPQHLGQLARRSVADSSPPAGRQMMTRIETVCPCSTRRPQPRRQKHGGDAFQDVRPRCARACAI